MKKLIGVLLLSTALMGNVEAMRSDSTGIMRWIDDKLENPSLTIKKTIDVICITADLVGTKDSSIVDEDGLLSALTGCIKLLSNWVDLQMLEDHYLPYYLKERLLKLRWYQEKKREQYRNKQKAPNILQLLQLR